MNKSYKVISISIAAYNVEKYIESALESISKSKFLDNIEVLVVDDGSNDKTYKIALKYVECFPNSYKIIKKANGGYGSTINESLKIAKGKYYKLLDGDDYYNTEGLDNLVYRLNELDVDMVLTHTLRFNDKGSWIDNYNWKEYNNKTVDINCIEPKFVVGMWETTYKTALLKEHMRLLPEKRLYTDTLYVCYPLVYVKKVHFMSDVVYCYRIGQDGQSVSKESRIKHCEENLNNIRLIIDYYYESGGDELAPFIKKRFYLHYRWYIINILLLPFSFKNYLRIREFEVEGKKNYIGFYNDAKASKNIQVIRFLKFFGYFLVKLRGVKSW